MIEKKGFKIGAKDFFNNKLLKVKTKHYGVDLALNAEFSGKDSMGKVVDKPDEDHGHLYIHYQPTVPPDKPGSILIGIEGAAPSSSKHSKTGASESKTAIDGSKFRDLIHKKLHAAEEIYKNTVIPKNIDGLKIKLSTKAINELTEIDVNNYGEELAHITPSKSVEEFKSKFKNKIFHISPKILKSGQFKENIVIDEFKIKGSQSKYVKIMKSIVKVTKSTSAIIPKKIKPFGVTKKSYFSK